MKKIKDMSFGELAAFVCQHLLNKNIKCVLSGGACISIYSENKYQSFDFDFIEMHYNSRKNLVSVMAEIGFKEKNRYFFHDDSVFYVEFPSGPLSIGSERINDFNEIIYSTGKLFLLTPTDCIKDRLAAYFYWNDFQSLEQARLVADCQVINKDELEKWVKNEGQEKKFFEIKDTLFK